jgi:hypothetical protein
LKFVEETTGLVLFFCGSKMEYISSQNRHQLSFGSLEDAIEKDNPVRVIEAFVEALDLSSLNFTNNGNKLSFGNSKRNIL